MSRVEDGLCSTQPPGSFVFFILKIQTLASKIVDVRYELVSGIDICATHANPDIFSRPMW